MNLEENRQPMTDLIVLLPGILGSTLARNGKEIWGTSIGGIARNLWSLGQNYRALQLPIDIGDEDPGDGVVALNLMPRATMIPGFLKIDGYTALVEFLERNFAVERSQHGRAGNLIEFSYDWRLSNRLNAGRLAQIAIPALERWRRQTGNQEAKIILIAHSMGGLISRWFLECLGGKAITRRLITLGTPYRGSINAVTTLCNGLSPGLGRLRLVLDDLVRSFPSLYQLLPTYDCIEADNDRQANLRNVALPNVRARDIADALAFHSQISEKAGPKGDYAIHALKGICQPTAQTFSIVRGRAEAINSYGGVDYYGDGTVPRISSHPQEWSDDSTAGFFGLQHASLAADPDIHRQLFGILTTERLRRFMGGPNLGLQMPDLISSGERLEIFVRSDDNDSTLALEATARGEDGFALPPIPLRPIGKGGYRGEIEMLAPQAYAVQISSCGPTSVNGVTGFTLVWNDAALNM